MCCLFIGRNKNKQAKKTKSHRHILFTSYLDPYPAGDKHEDSTAPELLETRTGNLLGHEGTPGSGEGGRVTGGYAVEEGEHCLFFKGSVWGVKGREGVGG